MVQTVQCKFIASSKSYIQTPALKKQKKAKEFIKIRQIRRNVRIRMAGEYWGNTVYSYQNGKKRSVETT
jgi:hypothetical protein